MSAEPMMAAADDAWAQMMAHLGEYRNAVLTGLDARGYPYSVRLLPVPDGATRRLLTRAAPGMPIRPGPASLLCHRHDERLWNQRSFLVRGIIEREGSQWSFQPQQYIEGVGYGGMLGLVRFVIGARRAANAYLAKRGLPRPGIPWAEVIAAKRAANLTRRVRRAAHPALALAAAIGVIGVVSLVAALYLARRNLTR
jgi:hypothetical protein